MLFIMSMVIFMMKLLLKESLGGVLKGFIVVLILSRTSQFTLDNPCAVIDSEKQMWAYWKAEEISNLLQPFSDQSIP